MPHGSASFARKIWRPGFCYYGYCLNLMTAGLNHVNHAVLASVDDSVWSSVYDSVRASVLDSVLDGVWSSVHAILRDTINDKLSEYEF
jgi:hypothetical protein